MPVIEADFYIYTHASPRDGEIFEVAMGRGKRAWDPAHRSPLWKKKALRAGGFDVRIVEGCLTRDQAAASLKQWAWKAGATLLEGRWEYKMQSENVKTLDWATIKANQVVKGTRFSLGHSLPTRDKIAEALRRERIHTIKGVILRLYEGGLLNGDLETAIMRLAEREEALSQ
jgi:hypothetical protein